MRKQKPLLTSQDQRVLEFIRSFELRKGEPPTRQEIAQGLKLSNLMAAQRAVNKLKEHGKLTYNKQSKRGLSLVDVPRLISDVVEIKMLGVVAAGRPIEAIERGDVNLKVPASMLKSGYSHFALRVSGQSMIEDHILDGDYVIVREQSIANNGQTVVALLDGEATLKRLYQKDGRIELRPANPEFSPIIVESHQHLRILGVYVGLIRVKK